MKPGRSAMKCIVKSSCGILKLLFLASVMIGFCPAIQAQATASAGIRATIISSASMTDLSLSPDNSSEFLLQNGKDLCFDVQICRTPAENEAGSPAILPNPSLSITHHQTASGVITKTQLTISGNTAGKREQLPQTAPYAVLVNYN